MRDSKKVGLDHHIRTYWANLVVGKYFQQRKLQRVVDQKHDGISAS
jgi:hypothetical protein